MFLKALRTSIGSIFPPRRLPFVDWWTREPPLSDVKRNNELSHMLPVPSFIDLACIASFMALNVLSTDLAIASSCRRW